MWRDIDSLRRQNALSRQQNEEIRKENEAIERETERIDQEIEQIEQEIEQIDRETEQIEQETAILRRQNKALAFLESRAFDKMIKEMAGPGEGDARHPLDRVDVGLLCEKLVENGCDELDLPFVLDALDIDRHPSDVKKPNKDCEDALISNSTHKSADTDNHVLFWPSRIGRFNESKSTPQPGVSIFWHSFNDNDLTLSHASEGKDNDTQSVFCYFRNDYNRMILLRGNWLQESINESMAPIKFERIVFPFEECAFHAPPDGIIQVFRPSVSDLPIQNIPAKHLLAECSHADQASPITQKPRIDRLNDIQVNSSPDLRNDLQNA